MIRLQKVEVKDRDLSVPQVVCVILIIIGITGLKILGKE